MNHPKVIVVGATGNVGRKVTNLLVDNNICSPNNLILCASERSAGKIINISGSDVTVVGTDPSVFEKGQIAVFNTESDISSELVPIALNAGCYVVDSSSHYRLDNNVPLVVPPVNTDKISLNNKLIAHANCLVSPIATVVAPIHRVCPIKRLVVSTYQSTSGAGKASMDECYNETASIINGKNFTRTQFKRQIAFNAIPQVGSIMSDGKTSEEYKIIHELKKVVDPEIKVAVTAVRVPVMIGHSITIAIEFYKRTTPESLRDILAHANSVVLSESDYHTPVEVVGKQEVFVGRLRRDDSVEHGVQLWTCSDNLVRGAAWDAVEIVRKLKEMHFSK